MVTFEGYVLLNLPIRPKRLQNPEQNPSAVAKNSGSIPRLSSVAACGEAPPSGVPFCDSTALLCCPVPVCSEILLLADLISATLSSPDLPEAPKLPGVARLVKVGVLT